MQELSSESVAEAVLRASRALVAIAARSLSASQEDVTLPQYRAIVVLCAQGPSTMSELAEELDCSASTATRLVDRLVTKDLVHRAPRESNRREVEVQATTSGAALVKDVTKRRRVEIERIIEAMPPRQRPALVSALQAFAEAAGEAPDQAWATGWDL